MFQNIPIRYRLALALCIGMTVIFSTMGMVVYNHVASKLYESVDAALFVSARSIRDARFGNQLSQPVMQQFLESLLHPDRVIRPYAQLVDFSGNVSLRSDNILITLPVSPLALARAEQGQLTYETIEQGRFGVFRQLTLPVYRSGRFTNELVQVAASLGGISHSLKQVLWLLWTALPLSLLLSIGFAYYITRRSLMPVTKITAAASRLSSSDLKMRLPVSKAKDEIRELAEQFNAMIARLDDSFTRLHRFAGDVSHELRTPLSVMRGESELALRKIRPAEEYQQALKIISRESCNMSGTVENLLLLARAESKSMAIHLHTKVLLPYFEGIVEGVNYEKLNDDVKIKLNFLLTPDFQTQISDTYLDIAIRNLLRNAIKHSPSGTEVVLNVQKYGEYLLIEVVDFGPGIPEDQLSKIFDPFYRVDSARNRKVGGVGLGLSLARALTELMGGEIGVKSEINHGSTFTIRLPISKAS